MIFDFIDASEAWRNYYAKVRLIGGCLYMSKVWCEVDKVIEPGGTQPLGKEVLISTSDLTYMLNGEGNWDLLLVAVGT